MYHFYLYENICFIKQASLLATISIFCVGGGDDNIRSTKRSELTHQLLIQQKK
jgi:hypothetical protein